MLVLPVHSSKYYVIIKDNQYYCVSDSIFSQEPQVSNGELGGKRFAVKASDELRAGYEAFRAFDESKTTYFHSGMVNLNADGTKNPHQWLIFYNPSPLKVKSLTIYNQGVDKYCLRQYKILGSNDNSDYTLLVEGEIPQPDLESNRIEVNDTHGWKYYKIECISTTRNPNYWTMSNCEIETWSGNA